MAGDRQGRQQGQGGRTVPEVRAIFDRAQAIDDFKSVSGKDLDIKKVGDKVVVSYAYEREIPCSARPT
jgi:hypothetical protein